ncbi:MAG: NADH-ubiquinone oxidoreductase-F iron-sulfur binding region domain-containing protein [Acidobacteriota bacterium]
MSAGRNRLPTFAALIPGAALRRAAAVSPGDIRDAVRRSGLRGRGGAGFLTGVKWNLAAAAGGQEKYVICNADEGEPGTFKDRLLLSDFTELVFEGMTLAGRAIGGRCGIVYLRGEYRYLVPHLESILAKRRTKGLLGREILGVNGFDFDVEIRLGSGAYVCGEETALIESLEGHRGEPRNRPPYPVTMGFRGCPTVVNNVETLVLACGVAAHGPEWLRSVGTEDSPGPKLLSVSGDCTRPGVYEFPLGTPLRDVLGAAGGSDAKAVQVGGAAGVCVPRSQFGRRLSYEDLSTGGAVIVLGPGRDMLAVARNFVEFFNDESCGQCTPCRYGNAALMAGIEKLEQGRCSISELNDLLALGETMQLASKCGLGQTSPNAFRSIASHFRGEILGHGQGNGGGHE